VVDILLLCHIRDIITLLLHYQLYVNRSSV